jgi:hypothetical protein
MCTSLPIDRGQEERAAFDEATLDMLEQLLKTVQRIAKCRGAVALDRPEDLTHVAECWEAAAVCVAELVHHVDEASTDLGVLP